MLYEIQRVRENTQNFNSLNENITDLGAFL
jgi:hypothetical protein